MQERSARIAPPPPPLPPPSRDHVEALRHALGKLAERLETTVMEINEQVLLPTRVTMFQGKEIDKMRVAIAGKAGPLKLAQTRLNMRTQRGARWAGDRG